jgi:hypothetical protein
MSTPARVPLPLPLSSSPYSDAHDAAVMKRINNYIERANLKLPNGTVAERLEWAWHENITQRELSPAESVDTVGRDADCYFAARHIIAADKSQAKKEFHRELGEVAMPIYTAFKYVDEATQWLGAPPFMRSAPIPGTNKKLPNAPPGGGIWEQRGANDGMVDSGQDVKPALGHFLKRDNPPPA